MIHTIRRRLPSGGTRRCVLAGSVVFNGACCIFVSDWQLVSGLPSGVIRSRRMAPREVIHHSRDPGLRNLIFVPEPSAKTLLPNSGCPFLNCEVFFLRLLARSESEDHPSSHVAERARDNARSHRMLAALNVRSSRTGILYILR
jgi:hypothetical protein